MKTKTSHSWKALQPNIKHNYNWILYLIVGGLIAYTLAEVFFKPFIN